MILEPTKRTRTAGTGSATLTLEVPRQFAVDFNIKKLLVMVRKDLRNALIAGGSRALRKTYRQERVHGSATRASTGIVCEAGNASDYLSRMFPRVAPDVLDRTVDLWLGLAMPEAGGGVETPVDVPDNDEDFWTREGIRQEKVYRKAERAARRRRGPDEG